MYKRILVPLDGSKEAEHALPHIKTAATGYEPPAKVILYRAIQPVVPLEKSDRTLINKVIEEERKLEESASKYLQNIADKLEKDGVDVEKPVMVGARIGDVASDILDCAEGNEVDLIIMTTHGRSGISRWAFGSVTDRVLRHSNVPVLVVPPHGYRESK
jgi:nucleotide-binding universal stress UspA family protein